MTGILGRGALSLLLWSAVAAPGQAADADGIAPDPDLAVYTNCAVCHGASGEGRFGPAFKGNADLAEAGFVVGMILRGTEHMPSFRSQLSDEDIASVATYIRSHWGNNWSAVTPADVKRQRAEDAASEGSGH
ncbi:MAG: cytochrome c [Rhizomicrobium sp.]